MKNSISSIYNLYLLDCALLFTHEVDSGYWQEWSLFGIPGGNQVFLLLNLILFLITLFGIKQIQQERPSAIWFSVVLAAGGVFAFIIHMVFILLGHSEFTEPASLLVLGALLVVSLMLGGTTFRQRELNK